jgi:hypothetical protein
MQIIIAMLALLLLVTIPSSLLHDASALYCSRPQDVENPRCDGGPGPGPGPHRPIIEFPTLAEIFAYLEEVGNKTELKAIANSTHGEPSELRTDITATGYITWVAWLGKTNGTNHVFLTGSFDGGMNFTEPVQLDPVDAGNASKLQLGLSDDGQFIFVVWQDTNPINGTSRIFVSSSMDYGKSFKTYPLNVPGDGNARDATLVVGPDGTISLVFIQEGDSDFCEGGTVCHHGAFW